MQSFVENIAKVTPYLAEWIEQRLQSAGVPGRLGFVDVDGTAAC